MLGGTIVVTFGLERSIVTEAESDDCEESVDGTDRQFKRMRGRPDGMSVL